MDDLNEAQFLQLLRRQLEESGVPPVAHVALDPSRSRLTTWDRRLAITAEVRDVGPGQVHTHVVSWFARSRSPGGKEKLDACVMGFGKAPEQAYGQAAEVWLRLVAAPILSCLAAQTILDADHFEGDEPWGIPGGHGFVGPFMTRGAGEDVDQHLLAECVAFTFDGYPRDGRPHLAKVTLLGQNGAWERHVEVDGHTQQHSELGWTALPAPTSTVVCTRFAVFVCD
jgi:hypothetical protein